eukprot:4772130-Prymnesium_polylepis.1
MAIPSWYSRPSRPPSPSGRCSTSRPCPPAAALQVAQIHAAIWVNLPPARGGWLAKWRHSGL